MRRVTMFVLAATPVWLGAQSAPDVAEAARMAVRSALRNIVTVQEMHFAERGRYATELDALAARFRPPSGVTVQIVEAALNGYGLIGTSEAMGDGNCGVAIALGATAKVATRREHRVYPEGAVACDGDARSEREVWAEYAVQALPNLLRRLVKSQERHFGKTGGYADSLAQLDGWRLNPEQQVTIEVARIRDRSTGFRATVSHTRAPGASCVIYVGFGPWRGQVMTPRDSVRAKVEMYPVCDDFGS